MAAGGTTFLTIAGKQYDLTGDFTVNPGGTVREPIPGLSGGSVAYTETVEDGEFEGTFVTVPALHVADIRAIHNAEGQIENAGNARKYASSTIFCKKCDPIDATKGTMKATFGTFGPMREV